MIHASFLSGVFVVLATGSVALLVALLLRYRGEPREETDYSPTRYAPMTRLLDSQESAFLAAQPGVTRAELAAFRKQRRGVFRLYLQELVGDFSAMHTEARLLAAASPEKNPELVGMLMRSQVRFWASLALVEMQLVLDAAGAHRVHPDGLLENVATLHAALVRATTVPGPVPVA